MSGVATGSVVQGGAAVALALGFALLASRRMNVSIAICTGQMLAALVAALVQGDVLVATAELVQAVAFAWWGDALLPGLQHGGRRRSVHVITANRGATIEPPVAVVLVAGAVLTALALAVPDAGIAFAVVLLGLLVSATERRPLHQVLGLAAAQSGLLLSALSVRATGLALGLTVLPLLPGLGATGLWLGANRRRVAAWLAPHVAAWIDVAISCLALLCAATLPWHLGLAGDGWRVDARAAHMALLLGALAAAGSWRQRDARPIWGSRLAILAGTVLAVVAVAPLLAWVGMAVATCGVVVSTLPARAEAWRRLRLGSTGLALAWFGAIALHAAAPPLAAMAASMLGYGSLAVLAPELTVAAVAVVVRLPAPPVLLLATGLAALGLGAALSLAALSTWPRHVPGPDPGIARASSPTDPTWLRSLDPIDRARMARSGPPTAMAIAGLAQAGIAVFAFGLGSSGGAFAGLLQLTFLALTQCALLLSQPNGVDRLAALAGLGGVPPFGVFASLGLVVAATASTAPLLLIPLGIGLAAIAWTMLRQIPAERRLCASPAWLPLALLLLCGFAMPASWLAWFRLAAQ